MQKGKVFPWKCNEFDKDCSGKPRCGWRRQKVAELVLTWCSGQRQVTPRTHRCWFSRHDCVLLRQLVTRGSEKDFVYARSGCKNWKVIMVIPPFPTSWGNESKFKKFLQDIRCPQAGGWCIEVSIYKLIEYCSIIVVLLDDMNKILRCDSIP